MLDSKRICAFVLALVSSMAVLGAAAAGDDGGPRVCTSAAGKPSCTILRPPAPPKRDVPADAPECIVAVGGLGSDNDDRAFDDLFAAFRNDPRYVIHRFGSSGAHPDLYAYDTYGSIDAGGIALLRYVRRLSGTCHAIHVVAHSMGGAVADRAFSLGLSAADGVVTYLPISTPHNGALLAQILTGANDVSDEGNEALRQISRGLRAAGLPAHDLTSDAVRDLAAIKMSRPPRDVLELRQRLANDEIVLLPDNWDWRYDSRDRLPDLHGVDDFAGDLAAGNYAALFGDAVTVAKNTAQRGIAVLQEIEGHGGSLVNSAIRTTTEFVIRHLKLPPDDRDVREKVLAFALSIGMLILMVKLAMKVSEVLLAGVLLGTWVTVPLRAALPGWESWWTTSWPHLLEKTAGTLIDERVQYLKAVVTRLRNEVDRLATDGEADNDDGHIHRVVDPRVALVRAVLGRAADLLSHL
jgi:hypothetical protein